MKQTEIDKLSLVERATAPTPGLFVKLRNIALALAAVSGALLASPVALPAIITTIAGYLGVAATVASAVSQIAVKG
ncbi:hypothetical protein [Flavihumibacter sp.]|uniref:hypothetical protein n=1 Tax=Flavihumibacter sp. TaxID=1913981 RepID=UPI002FC5E981